MEHSLRRGKGGSGYVSKAEPPGFAGGLDVECEKEGQGFWSKQWEEWNFPCAKTGRGAGLRQGI